MVLLRVFVNVISVTLIDPANFTRTVNDHLVLDFRDQSQDTARLYNYFMNFETDLTNQRHTSLLHSNKTNPGEDS